MTIDRALKALYLQRNTGFWPSEETGREAVKVAIEALEQLHQYRLDGEEMRFTPLASETKTEFLASIQK